MKFCFSDAKMANQVAKKSIEIAHKVLDLYNSIDTRLPWSKFRKSLHDIDEYTNYYSEKGAALAGNTKTYLLNAIDAHFESSRHISEWCSLITPLLKTHAVLYTGYTASKANAQNRLMQKVLTDGVHRTELSQIDVELISSNLNEANETLSKLFKQFEIDYDEGSSFFKIKLNHIKGDLPRKFGDMYGEREKKAVADLKAQLAAVLKFYINLRGLVSGALAEIMSIAAVTEEQTMVFEELLHESEKLTDFESIEIDAELNGSIAKTTQDLLAKTDKYVKEQRGTFDE